MKMRNFTRYLGILNYHKKNNKEKNIFIFVTPRSGSTWLMEIIALQPHMKYINEPLNIRNPFVRKHLLNHFWEILLPNPKREEILYKYFNNLTNNKIKTLNPIPTKRYYRFYTDRIVFKIHAVKDMINWFEEKFDPHIIYLIRHPVAVTLSRKKLPRLEYFIKNKIYCEKYLNKDQSEFAKNIIRIGTNFERGILSWCLQNLPPLKFQNNKEWIILSYEEMVLKPDKILNMLSERLNLKVFNKEIIYKPSMNIYKNDFETLNALSDSNLEKSKEFLIKKWEKRIGPEQKEMAFKILKKFEIDAYNINGYLPHNRYLNF